MARAPYSGVAEVQQQGSSGSFDRTQANPQEFGSGVGQAEQGLAQSGERLGSVLAEHAVRLQELDNNRDASQAINQYMVEAGKEWASYGSMEGQQANDYYPTFQKNLADLREKYGGGLTTEMARQKYDQESRFMTTRLVMQGAGHAAQGLRQSYKTTNAQTFDSAVQVGILGQNDMPSVALQAARAANSVRDTAILNGMTPEQAANEGQKGRGLFYQKLFHDMLTQPKQVDNAASMYQTVRPNLDGASIGAIDQMMKPVLRKRIMDGWVNDAMGGSAAGFVGGRGGGSDHVPAAYLPFYKEASARTGLPVDVLIAQGKQESGFDPNAKGSAGEVGLHQIKPSTAKDPGFGMVGIDPATLSDPRVNINFAADYLKARAGARADFSDPAAVDAALKNFNGGGDPNYVQNVRRHMGGAGVINPDVQKSPAEMAFPDEQAIVQKALRDFSDDPYEAQQVIGAVRSRFATLNLAVKRDRDALSKTIPEMEAQALDGHDIQIPEAQIRHVFPPEKAAELIESLGISKAVGPQFQAIKWGTPDQVVEAEARLSSNLGLGGANPETSELPDMEGSNEAYRMRRNLLKKFQTAVNARNHALNGPQADPASYIASSPLMQQSGAQLVAPMPDGLSREQQQAVATQRAETFARDSISFQQGLGVRVPHVLTRASAQKTVAQFQNADPATTDVGQMLASEARANGQAWPQVFGDLKTMGGLSPEYQTLAQIESPVARANFQRMLKLTAEKGGRDELHKMAGTVNMHAINDAIQNNQNQALLDFQKTAQIPGIRANLDQINQVTQGVRDLAAFYSLPGGGSPASHSLFSSTPSALERAANEIIGSKYAFDTTDNYLRVPVAQVSMKQVQDYGDALKARLTAEDLRPSKSPVTAETLGIKPADQEIADRIQRDVVTPIQEAGTNLIGNIQRTGKWVTNESDSGAYLTAQDLNGIPRAVQKADGSRIEFSWKEARGGPPPTPARTLQPAEFPVVP